MTAHYTFRDKSDYYYFHEQIKIRYQNGNKVFNPNMCIIDL